MDPEQWKRIDDLLQDALSRPFTESDAFLRQACAGDEALEREVRSLFSSQQKAGDFLRSPAIEVAARSLAHEQVAGKSNEAHEANEVSIGRTVSHYHIVEKLGDGGMGVVWKARDTRLERFVALKLLPAARMNDPERKRRFIQEARTASALNHPNIITIYDIGQAGPEGDPADFIAMEYVPGKALNQFIGRKGLRLNEALPYAIQMADALVAAHAAGIVHRDLKPGNVMVNENGSVKVLDFGLAKLTEPAVAVETAHTVSDVEAPQTEEGMIVGTISYMSPEQAEGKKVDGRTDIFSFGAVLYEIVTGRRAFDGDSKAGVLSAILRGEPKPPSEIVRGLPRALDRIITRCLQKDPNLRYQHAGDLKIDLQQVSQDTTEVDSAIRVEMPERRRVGRWWWLAAAAACVAVSAWVGWRLYGPQSAPGPWKLTRLTSDAGLTGPPAMSRDGKLVVYSSDRGLEGDWDLYIKQVAGGQPIRLTSGGADNAQPDFSPDGSKIVFRSDRDGGGIYEMPAFGGDVRLLARDGLNPKFSADGSQVAYWVGNGNVAGTIPGVGEVWVVPAAGGPPQRVGPSFATARHPIWSPDGKHVLFAGYTSAKAFDSSNIDWWVVATNGGEAVRTGAHEALKRAGLGVTDTAVDIPVPGIPSPGCWSAADNTVIFSVANGSGRTRNLWEIGISPETGKVTGIPKRLTTGAGDDLDPSCASGGALTFRNLDTKRQVWSMPFDLVRGTPKGALERVTDGPAAREGPSLSNNGRYLALVSDQGGRSNIWLRELATGKESVLASSFAQRFPVSNASGTRVAYSVYEKDKRVVYVSSPGGVPERLCEGCLRATDWSRDEKTLLVFGGDPYRIGVLDLASHQQTPLLKHPTYSLLYGRFSPDNRWVSFTARIQSNRGRIVVAPIDGPKPIPESAWITIAETGIEDYANWSPDGKTLYFTSGKDGHNCVWGQRIEATSHRPAGEAFAVRHFHGRVSFGHGGWTAAGGRIELALVESTGNIWMMSRSGAR
jgi:Tol biopolymer transport system component